MVSSIGAFGFGLSQLLFAYIIFSSIRGGAKASDKVWDSGTPQGLEWTLSSPPPYHSFETAPEVK
jgi:cytochrome c oxidase subunit 1